jgi:hypothetical protein
MPEFLNIEIINWEDFFDLIFRTVFNLAVVLYLVRILYYQSTPQKGYLFTFILISQVIFFILFLLVDVYVNLGFALGMFAVFGIIRYRTQQIPAREMTYLFLVIGISVINGLANRKMSYAELVFTNAAIILITYLLERVFLLRHEIKKEINYNNIELVKPERREELIHDLEERTGLRIHKVEIGRIDYLRNSARLYIFYFAENDENQAVENNNESEY